MRTVINTVHISSTDEIFLTSFRTRGKGVTPISPASQLTDMCSVFSHSYTVVVVLVDVDTVVDVDVVVDDVLVVVELVEVVVVDVDVY